MSRYRSRRLRPRRPAPGPPVALVTTMPVTREQADQIRRLWLDAGRRRVPIILDGTRFRIERLDTPSPAPAPTTADVLAVIERERDREGGQYEPDDRDLAASIASTWRAILNGHREARP